MLAITSRRTRATRPIREESPDTNKCHCTTPGGAPPSVHGTETRRAMDAGTRWGRRAGQKASVLSTSQPGPASLRARSAASCDEAPPTTMVRERGPPTCRIRTR